ncbi:MAG: hypothetical protein V1767_01395 [Chloroflexota bacterium]
MDEAEMSNLKLFNIAAVITMVLVWVPGCASKPTRTATERLLLKGYSTVIISPDGKRVAYDNRYEIRPEGFRARLDSGGLIVDGVERKQYEKIGYATFSPDSKRLAYAAAVNNKWVAVIDGVEGVKQYDDIKFLTFSPDSKRLLYTAQVGGKWQVVVDGIEGKQYDFLDSPIFSPDSKHYAYIALTGRNMLEGKLFVVEDGVESQPYKYLRDLVFSPDGRLAYYAQKFDSRYIIMENGAERDVGNAAILESSLAFTPDNRLVYFTPAYYMVGTAKVEMNIGMALSPVLSPDGKRVAYLKSSSALSGRPMVRMYIDGKKTKRYDGLGCPVFSLDSKHLAYAAYFHDTKGWFVVVDGTEGKGYDRLLTPGYTNLASMGSSGTVLFDSPNSIHYAAQSGSSIYWVEETIK